MKANVNYNLKGDEEPGVQGRAQNTQFTISWARPLNFGGSLSQCQNIRIYLVFATLAPQRHPRRSIFAIFDPTMSATPQFGGQIWSNLVPYKQFLKPDDARKGYHETTMSTKHLLQVTRVPE